MQLFTGEEVEFEQPTEKDFIVSEKPPKEVEVLLRKICYDCHSNQINYPWYSKIAPVSWWIKDHINVGREHFNFSEWGNYPQGKKAHKAEECWEEVEEGEMPLQSYTFIHRDATLSDTDKALLINYFKQIEAAYH